MNENNMLNNENNDMMMNSFDSFDSEGGGATYHAKRPNIQILGPDGKPMAPIPEQNLEDTMIINQPITESQTFAQTAPQPVVSNEEASVVNSAGVQPSVVEQAPVYNQGDVQIEMPINNTVTEQQTVVEQSVQINESSVLPQAEVTNTVPVTNNMSTEVLVETAQQAPAYNPSDIQIEEPKAMQEVQPVVEQSVTVTSPVESPVSTPNYQESEIYIEEPKQVEQQPVMTQPDMNVVTQSSVQNVEVTSQDASQSMESAPGVNTVVTQQPEEAPKPAVNPALRGFSWAQPPTDNGEQ